MSNPTYSRRVSRIYFPGPHQLQIEEKSLTGSLQPHEILLKCHYSLISAGTELAIYTQTHIGFGDPQNSYARYPFYPGYAAVGRVEAVGAAVRRFAAGDLVYYPGLHQNYQVLSAHDGQICATPPDMSLRRVPFAAMVAIAYTSVYMSGATPGDSVAVLGLGLVGNLAGQLFQRQASSVIGVDLVEFRRQLAQQAGIERTVEAEHQDIVQRVREMTGGLGPGTVIEATGNPMLVTPALTMVRERGEVILLGSPRGKAEIDLYTHIHRKGIHLIGAHARLVPGQTESGASISRATTIPQLLRMLHQGHILVEHLVTDVVQPGDAQAAYEALLTQKQRTMAVLIDWADRS